MFRSVFYTCSCEGMVQKTTHWEKHIGFFFMQDISKECKLSKRYTNYSIRVTGTTALTVDMPAILCI